jgi:hypothetical protein
VKKSSKAIAKGNRRKPLFGWNAPADIQRAKEYLDAAARTDSELLYDDDHFKKLRDLGVSIGAAHILFKKCYPQLRRDAKYSLEILRRLTVFYTDAPGDPGADAKGGDYELEEASDGSWSKSWNHTKLAPLGEWQWIADSNQFIHDDGLLRYGDKQFERLFGKLTAKPLMTEINRGKVPMKKFAAQVYIPKSPPVMKHDGRTVFNIWRESAMQPDFGDVQWFLDHVAIMFPGKSDRVHLLDYMAQLIQRPEVKIHFALLIQSIEGAGKGALARILRQIIGDRNVVEPSNDEVLKTFTGWQEGAQLAIINELMADGRHDVLNRLKSPITEDTLRIEKKFGNTFTIPNHMNLFCMTNFRDALPLTQGDRRWLVLYSPALKQKPEYYDRLFANIGDDSKVAAVMEFLLTWEIQFNPKAPAPWTAAKADMQELAQTDTEADLQSRYEAGHSPFDHPLVRVADIVTQIQIDNKHARHVHRASMMFLDRIKAAKLRRYKEGKHGLAPVQLYAIRDHAKWQAVKPVDAARAYHAQDREDGDNDSHWDT